MWSTHIVSLLSSLCRFKLADELWDIFIVQNHTCFFHWAGDLMQSWWNHSHFARTAKVRAARAWPPTPRLTHVTLGMFTARSHGLLLFSGGVGTFLWCCLILHTPARSPDGGADTQSSFYHQQIDSMFLHFSVCAWSDSLITSALVCVPLSCRRRRSHVSLCRRRRTGTSLACRCQPDKERPSFQRAPPTYLWQWLHSAPPLCDNTHTDCAKTHRAGPSAAAELPGKHKPTRWRPILSPGIATWWSCSCWALVLHRLYRDDINNVGLRQERGCDTGVMRLDLMQRLICMLCKPQMHRWGFVQQSSSRVQKSLETLNESFPHMTEEQNLL